LVFPELAVMNRAGLFAVSLIAVSLCGCGSTPRSQANFETTQRQAASGLPLPSTLSREDYQPLLYQFLGSLRYRDMGWTHDKGIRDTGPYKNGKYFGTHLAVKIYYSPEMMKWLVEGRKGEVPDGAMMIKEMYPPPAPRYAGKEEPLPHQWTVMVRDKAGSHDGWYWSYYGDQPPQEVDNNDFPFEYANSGFGLYCVRCHSSAESLNTFASLENIEGFPGQPIAYEVDDSWKSDGQEEPDAHPNGKALPSTDTHPNAKALADLRRYLAKVAPPSHNFVNQDWLAQYPQFPVSNTAEVEPIPPISAITQVAKNHRQFMTSDQCLSCHSGDNSPFGPNLIKNDVDISPHGEWQWSMMGLAGRDPIFYAQVDTESALYNKPGTQLSAESIQNLCLHCHGVMGQRQFQLDHPGENFSLAKAKLPENHDYAALSLDGISCTVCHQMSDPRNADLEQTRTGDFTLVPRQNGLLSIFGPFANPETHPMVESLGALPRQADYMRDSSLCASCHTVFLPVLNTQGQVVDHKYEQATYLEWLNSNFADGRTQTKSCQECHMPDSFQGPIGEVKIANVQDQDFPLTANQADVQVPKRTGYGRHTLLGINLYALEMFRQFPDVLGVRLKSFMTGFDNGLSQAIENARDNALNRSVRVEVLDAQRAANQLTVRLKTTNLIGHRFPTGVGFRRAFMEFLVLDSNQQVVWGSGRSNSLGVIVDQNGQNLPSEFHTNEAFQPHYQEITQQDEVQIYEELTRDSEGKFSTSFLARVQETKDNRLLPAGWTASGPPGFKAAFAEATLPHGDAASDPDFIDGTGSDTLTYRVALPAGTSFPVTVRATLYYQSLPPRYLKNRFDQSSDPATRRLHFLTSHLDDSKTHFAGWKLQVGRAQASIP
jgi:hypothetical protein